MSFRGKAAWMVVCLSSLVSVGCLEDDEDACGAGQKFENKVCVPDDDAGAMPGNDAAMPGNDAAMPGAVDTTGFGDVCTTSAECMPNALYCAVQPNAPTGYCTRQGCTEEAVAETCPTGWTCFDLSIFDPTLTTMCRKP